MSKRLTEKICPCCNKKFQPRRSRVVFCSKQCKSLDQWENKPETKKLFKPKITCRSCHRWAYGAGRGLCYPCYRNFPLRNKYNCFYRGKKPVNRDYVVGECFGCKEIKVFKNWPLCFNCWNDFQLRKLISHFKTTIRQSRVIGKPVFTKEQVFRLLENLEVEVKKLLKPLYGNIPL